MASDRWDLARAEHAQVLAHFLDAARAVPETRWQQAPSAGRWSAAVLTLHVTLSYEYGEAAARGQARMRRRVPWVAAWFARTVLLPRLLAAQRFPRGAESPSEVVPEEAVARRLTREALLERLVASASASAAALEDAELTNPRRRVTHAYFGALSPWLAQRLLSAHTRHHTAGLRERALS